MLTHMKFDDLKNYDNEFLKNIKLTFNFGHRVTEVPIITEDDNIFGFGQNECGFSGLGHNIQVKDPQLIQELCEKEIVRFVDGLYHVIALTSDGKIYSWGENKLGAFGNGNRNYSYNKPEINGYLINETVTDLSCGAFHSLVLTKSGQVFAFGYNNFGQIGNRSDKLFQLTPIMLNEFNGEKVISVSCGYNHSLALTEKGHVFSWGDNNCGQLGVEEIEGTYNMYKTRDLGKNFPTFVKVENDDNTEVLIEKICCGAQHSMLLSREGNIYLFGDNTSGQIGSNSFVNQMTPQKLNSSFKYKDIASHFRYNISIAVSVNDIYYVWGKLGEELIVNPKESQFKTIDNTFINNYQITHKNSRILFDFESIINSSLDVEKRHMKREIVPKIGLLNEFSLSSQIMTKYREHIFIQMESKHKTLFSFNDYDVDWPFEVIGKNTLVVGQDDTVYAFGSNNNGLIGFGHKNTINEPIVVKELCQKGIIDFANGAKHVIARTNNNQLYIWGYNRNGELGNDTNDDCFVPQLVEKLKNKNIIDVCCGYLHSLALTDRGKVYAWGSNEFGQIGNEYDNKHQLIPFKIEAFDEHKIVAISCGTYHSLALTSNGRVYSWGRNNCGQLGFINIIGSNVPKLIRIKDKDKSRVIFKKISCGSDHSLLLTTDGQIYGFGCNDMGQLANDSLENHYKPIKIETEIEFKGIVSAKDCFVSAALSVDDNYYIWGYCGQHINSSPKSIQFDSLDQVFLEYLPIKHKLNQKSVDYNNNSVL